MVKRQRVMAKVKIVLSKLIRFTCNLWNAIFVYLEYFLLNISDPWSWSGRPRFLLSWLVHQTDSKENQGHSRV